MIRLHLVGRIFEIRQQQRGRRRQRPEFFAARLPALPQRRGRRARRRRGRALPAQVWPQQRAAARGVAPRVGRHVQAEAGPPRLVRRVQARRGDAGQGRRAVHDGRRRHGAAAARGLPLRRGPGRGPGRRRVGGCGACGAARCRRARDVVRGREEARVARRGRGGVCGHGRRRVAGKATIAAATAIDGAQRLGDAEVRAAACGAHFTRSWGRCFRFGAARECQCGPCVGVCVWLGGPRLVPSGR